MGRIEAPTLVEFPLETSVRTTRDAKFGSAFAAVLWEAQLFDPLDR